MSHTASESQCATSWIHHSSSGNLLFSFCRRMATYLGMLLKNLTLPHIKSIMTCCHLDLKFMPSLYSLLPPSLPSHVPPLWTSSRVSFPVLSLCPGSHHDNISLPSLLENIQTLQQVLKAHKCLTLTSLTCDQFIVFQTIFFILESFLQKMTRQRPYIKEEGASDVH